MSGLARTQDGFYRRLAYSEGNPNQFGADVSRESGNDTGREAGRLSLLWTPSKTVDVLFSADMVNERQEPTEYQAVALSTPANIELYQRVVGTPRRAAALRELRARPSRGRTFATWPGYNNSDIWGTSMTLTWKGRPVAVKSITAYRDLFVQTKGDADATPLDIVAPGGVDIWQHQISQEVQLSGIGLQRPPHLGRRLLVLRRNRARHSAVAHAGRPLRRPGGGAVPVDRSRRQSERVCPAANCLGGGITNANDRAIARLSRTGERLMENDSYAVFVHGTFALTPRWSVTLGGRQSHESKAFTYSEIYPLLPLPYDDPSPSIANDNPSFPLTTLTDEWNTFTPKIGVEFKPSTDMLLYVQGSTGFKAGGFNGRPSPLTGLAPFARSGCERSRPASRATGSSTGCAPTRRCSSATTRDIQISRLSQIVAGVRVEENAGDGRTNGLRARSRRPRPSTG